MFSLSDDKDVHLTGQHGSLSLLKGQKTKINYCLIPVVISNQLTNFSATYYNAHATNDQVTLVFISLYNSQKLFM
jgi:hypothetical protein